MTTASAHLLLTSSALARASVCAMPSKEAPPRTHEPRTSLSSTDGTTTSNWTPAAVSMRRRAALLEASTSRVRSGTLGLAGLGGRCAVPVMEQLDDRRRRLLDRP